MSKEKKDYSILMLLTLLFVNALFFGPCFSSKEICEALFSKMDKLQSQLDKENSAALFKCYAVEQLWSVIQSCLFWSLQLFFFFILYSPPHLCNHMTKLPYKFVTGLSVTSAHNMTECFICVCWLAVSIVWYQLHVILENFDHTVSAVLFDKTGFVLLM